MGSLQHIQQLHCYILIWKIRRARDIWDLLFVPQPAIHLRYFRYPINTVNLYRRHKIKMLTSAIYRVCSYKYPPEGWSRGTRGPMSLLPCPAAFTFSTKSFTGSGDSTLMTTACAVATKWTVCGRHEFNINLSQIWCPHHLAAKATAITSDPIGIPSHRRRRMFCEL